MVYEAGEFEDGRRFGGPTLLVPVREGTGTGKIREQLNM
jgi:hypothetical protein